MASKAKGRLHIFMKIPFTVLKKTNFKLLILLKIQLSFAQQFALLPGVQMFLWIGSMYVRRNCVSKLLESNCLYPFEVTWSNLRMMYSFFGQFMLSRWFGKLVPRSMLLRICIPPLFLTCPCLYFTILHVYQKCWASIDHKVLTIFSVCFPLSLTSI